MVSQFSFNLYFFYFPIVQNYEDLCIVIVTIYVFLHSYLKVVFEGGGMG